MRRPIVRLSPCLLLAMLACGSPQQVAGPGSEPAPIHAAPPRSSGARPTTNAIDAGPLVVRRPALDRVLAAGPGRLLQQVPLEPVFASGHKFAGFRILSLFGDDPRVLRYGVLPGDVLLAVNGRRIVTPGDLMSTFEGMKTAKDLEVVVQRAGTQRTFRFAIIGEDVSP